MEVQNNLANYRLKRGFSVSQLAAAVGVSRQTIYAMESGSYIPNTLIALRLAQTLGVTVEDLFCLQQNLLPVQVEEVELVSDDVHMRAGQPLKLAEIDGRLIATQPEPGTWGLPVADAVAMEPASDSKRPKARAQVVADELKLEKRLLVAGCDPGASILARHLERSGIEMIVVYQNSSRALESLKRGVVHIAGSHIQDDKTGESNLPIIKKMFGKDSVAVFSFAFWEEGLVVAPGNPKKIRGISDLARSDVKITNREPGAGSRLLLDSHLARLGIAAESVRGYDKIALGHLPAARMVQLGRADCCINTRAAALISGLDFIPLVSKRYDLVVAKNHLKLPPVQSLLETLGRSAFRREIEGLTEYDMKAAGDRLV